MTEYQQCFQGSFTSALRWPQLDALWETLKQQSEGWYIYFVGKDLPDTIADKDSLIHFIEEIDQLLHKEHQHDYCGIVYSDDFKNPSMIKIFDPKHLGSSCGSSGQIVPPRWVLSKIPPDLIEDNAPVPMNRQRWWQHIWQAPTAS
jgi:hypothetical protein